MYAADQEKLNKLLKDGSKETATYIRGLDGAKASTDGLVQSAKAAGLSAKAASLGMKALSIAGSMLATMLISMALQAVITGLDNLAHASEHAKEALDDFHQKVKEGRDKLKEQYEFINSDEAKKLDELSKGVDAYGNSISLSTEQFTEYHSITNKVAEMFPAMVKGWDSQGNAILNNVDVLKQLNEEYKKAQDNHYNEIMGKTSDIVKNYNDYTTGALWGSLIGKQEEIDALEKYINGGFKGNDIMRDSAFLSAIKGIGLDIRDYKDLSGDISKQQRVIAQLQKLKNEQNAAFAPMKELLEAHAYTTKNGFNLTDDQSSIIDSFVNSFTYENSKGKTANELINEVNTFIAKLADNDNLDLSIDLAKLIKIDPNSVSEGELQDMWNDMLKRLEDAGFGEDIITRIKVVADIDDKKIEERDRKIQDVVDRMNTKPTKYGNININDRQEITWNEDTLNQYAAVLESWGDNAEEFRDTVSTLLGTWDEFEGIPIAFSPILQTEDGKGEYLDHDTVYKYIRAIVEKATGEDGKIDFDKIITIDAEGLEFDGKLIKGLIAGVGENAPHVAETMHDVTVDELKKEFGSEELNIILDPKFDVTGKSIQELRELIKKKAEDEPITLQTQYDDLEDSGFIHGINSIKKAMDELEDNGAVSYTSVFNNSKSQSKQGIMQLMGDVIPHEELEQYTKDITDMTASLESRRKTLINLTQAYISGLIAQGKFKDADENMIATVLNEAGVANSTAVAHDMVTAAKLRAAAAAVDLSDATGESIAKFEAEAKVLGLTETAISGLSSVFAAAQNVMTQAENNGAIARLKQLGIELEAIQSVSDAYEALGKGGYSDTEKSRARWRVENGKGSPIETALFGIGAARENIKGLIDELTSGITPSFKPSDKKDNTAKQVRDAKKQLDDLAKSEALDKLKYKFDDLERSITKVSDAISLLDSTLNLQAEDDYIGKLETTTMQIDLAQQKASLLRDEFTKLNAETPISAAMAQELANRMKSVADNIATNAKNMRDYGKNVAEYYTSALKSISSTQKATLDKATSLFERNVKSLSEGGLIGFDFSLSPTVPESAYEKQRKENKTLEEEMQRYYDAIAAMQKTALDLQYQEQVADNARKREDLNESLQNAKDNLAQFANTGVNAAEKVSNAFKDMVGKVKGAVDDINNHLSKNPITVNTGDNSTGGSNNKSSNNKSAITNFTSEPPATQSQFINNAESAYKEYTGAQEVKTAHIDSGQVKAALSQGAMITTFNATDGYYSFISTDGGKTFQRYDTNARHILKDKSTDFDFFKGKISYAITPVRMSAKSKHANMGYAKGTRDYKSYGTKPNGVAGENYKREVLINKKTGEKIVIDEPTLIDTNEYDVVGEKDTKEIFDNKNANGTFGNLFIPIFNDDTIQSNQNVDTKAALEDYYKDINDIHENAREEQFNAQLTDDARKQQELDKTLSDSVIKTQANNAVLENEQKNTNARTFTEQIADNKRKVKETQDFSGREKSEIIGLDNWMIQNPIKAPGLESNSWEAMVQEAEGYSNRIMGTISGIFTGSPSFESFGSTGGSTKGDAILAEAKKYIGTPYVWGGAAPGGFDCSGLVQYVNKQKGINLSHSTYAQINEGTPVNKNELRAGDLVFFGDGKSPDHVGIYAGKYNNIEHAFIHAPHTGDVVKYSDLDSQYYSTHFIGARRTYAKGTDTFPVHGKKPNGVVGENYKDEIIINKKTGETTKVNSPALIDTNEYDIVGEKQTAEMLKNQYAEGTFGNWKNLKLVGGLPFLSVDQINEIIKSTSFKGSAIDKAGAAQGIYNAQLKSGVSALFTLAAAAWEGGWAKSKVSYGKNNYWGWNHHPGGGKTHYQNATTFSSDIGEAFADYSNRLKKGYGNSSVDSMASMYVAGKKEYSAGNGWRNGMTSVLNSFGKLLNGKGLTNFASASDGLVDYASAIADNTANTSFAVKELRKDFKTQLKDFLAGGQISTEESNGYEDSLLGYIKDNVQIASKNNEKFIETYDALVAFQNENSFKLSALDDKLLKSVGTEDYARVREEIHNTTEAYTAEMLGMQAKLNVERTKQTYEDNQKALAAARKYYNERRANGANADELSVIVKGIDEILNEGRELSDQYVSEMKALTEFLVARAERVTKPYNDQLTWVQKTNEEFERELNYAEDISDRHAIISKQVKNYNQQLDINRKKQEAAHQAVLDLYDNEDYAPIFERYDIESWFDANGDFSTQFTKDLESMSMVMPELVPVMQQIAEQIQTQKKAWYEAGEAIDDVNDKLRDIDKQEADEKIELFVKSRERVAEALEFDKTINDTLTDIQESFYEFKDGLREAQNEIDAQLEANKHLDQWLDPDTRKQLFNEQDYAEESLEIARLLEESDAARIKYQEQISGLREDEQWKLEGITAEYNRQMDALKGQLDIAKQRLQTAKDLDAIENARKERDTQIIMGTRSQNVADPDKLYDLEMTAQKSRLELTNLETKQTEADEIRAMRADSDQLNTIISNINSVVDGINNLPEAFKEELAKLLPETEELMATLLSIAKDSPWGIITRDLTESSLLNIDLAKRIGYDPTVDESELVDILEQKMLNGDVKDEDIPIVMRKMAGLMHNHDNENLTNPFNTGYFSYGVGHLLNHSMGARLLDLYDYSYADALKRDAELEKEVVERFKRNAAVESVEYGGTVISGSGQVVIPNPSSYKLGDTTITAENVIATNGSAELDNRTVLTLSDGNYVDISGYKELTMQEMMENLGLGAFARDSLAIGMPDYSRLFEMEKILGGLDGVLSTAGSTDNSQNFRIDNIQIVDPTDTNAFVNDLLSQVKDIAKITKK